MTFELRWAGQGQAGLGKVRSACLRWGKDSNDMMIVRQPTALLSSSERTDPPEGGDAGQVGRPPRAEMLGTPTAAGNAVVEPGGSRSDLPAGSGHTVDTRGGGGEDLPSAVSDSCFACGSAHAPGSPCVLSPSQPDPTRYAEWVKNGAGWSER